MNPRLIGLLLVCVLAACGGDGGNDVDRLGIGAQCAGTIECLDGEGDAPGQTCLTQFKGGYCGLTGCVSDLDCPDLSACIAHSDGTNYCFRTCVDKPECNVNRDPANESNCSGSATFVDGTMGRKACIPPSSGV